MKLLPNTQKGFTLPELLIVIAIAGAILGLTFANTSNVIRKASLSTIITTLVTDLRSQQIKAMIGDTEGQLTPFAYGVYLEADKYTLFRGTSYSSSSPSNIVINLDNNLSITSITLPSSTILFNRVTGEVNNFAAGQDTFTIVDSVTTEQKTLQINRYGSIIAVN